MTLLLLVMNGNEETIAQQRIHHPQKKHREMSSNLQYTTLNHNLLPFRRYTCEFKQLALENIWGQTGVNFNIAEQLFLPLYTHCKISITIRQEIKEFQHKGKNKIKLI